MAHDPRLTKQQDQQVRRLLAEARHTEPMPADVAARLKRVLDELAQSPERPTETRTVVELASRRRRRATSLLVAAAAVVVLGVGLGQVVDLGQGDSSPTTADSLLAEGGGAGRSESRSGADTQMYLDSAPVRIRPAAFSTDVARTRQQLVTGELGLGAITGTDKSATESSPTESGSTESGPAASTESGGSTAYDCVLEEWGPGDYVPVQYGADRGVLVFRGATGESQVVDLFSCGSPEVLRSITLPVP